MADLRFLLVVTFAVSVVHTEAGQNTSMCECQSSATKQLQIVLYRFQENSTVS